MNNRNNSSSYRVLQTGGRDFGYYLKRKRLYLARILTDDAQFDIAIVMRDDERDIIRIGYAGQKPTNADESVSVFGGIRWEIAAVNRSRIVSIKRLD